MKKNLRKQWKRNRCLRGSWKKHTPKFEYKSLYLSCPDKQDSHVNNVNVS